MGSLKKTAETICKKMEYMKGLTDEQLRARTDEFRVRIKKGESLDKLLPEVYAVVGEAAFRSTGLRPYQVQFMGAVALHHGKIVEQRTGEGKTLVAAMPSYLNALEGKGVHVVTVNDYLAKRDAENIGRIHAFLGLTVGCVIGTTPQAEKKGEYAKDITYVTNTELGFDYLRDNMASSADMRVLRGFHYCIIDEVDSILIDEARTPLIIAGEGGKPANFYIACNELAKRLIRGKASEQTKADLIADGRKEEEGDYIIDEAKHTASLTVAGIQKCEQYFGIENLCSQGHTELMHGILAALRAHGLMKKDKDYVVKDGEVIIVDTFTGRLQPGRRYMDGLHQAIEAKEGVKIQQETSTFASVTYQNFFNKYEKKCGMTGTACTERKEFREIYHMGTVKIPTNRPDIREDHCDRLFVSKREKLDAVVNETTASHTKGQPVLVGTSTIRDSETLSDMLHDKNIPHTVLNAKLLEKEAQAVAQAGRYGAVTVATNMAGRGTDIKLDEEARKAGGLKVIGTQRHEARRIDNQLKGRAGRQGDPGESVFMVSLDDEVLRLYGPKRLESALKAASPENGEGLQGKSVDRFIKKAQTVISDNNFGVRKHVLEYDAVDNRQREAIYADRDAILEKADIRNAMIGMVKDAVYMTIDEYSLDRYMDQEEAEEMVDSIEVLIPGIHLPKNVNGMQRKALAKMCAKQAEARYYERESEWADKAVFREFERQVLLRSIDIRWMRHLDNLEILRQNISLVGYGQKDPAVVYKLKAYELFTEMMGGIKKDAVHGLFSSKLAAGAT